MGAIKAAEKQRASVIDGIPPTLPALLLADKVVDRLERAGTPVVASGDDLGARLLALVVEAHAAGVDPEQALRDAVRRVTPPPSVSPESARSPASVRRLERSGDRPRSEMQS